jgi:hypothetical protein
MPIATPDGTITVGSWAIDLADPLAAGRFRMLAGHAPKGADEVALSARLAAATHTRIGDTVRLGKPEQRRTMVAVVAEPGGAVVVVGTPKAAYAPAPVMAPPPPAPAMPPAVPGQPGAGSVTNQPGAVTNQPGAVTNQQGVVPSRPVGAPPVQGGQPAPAAQAGQGPATQRGAAGRPAPTRPSSSGSASTPVQPGSRSVGGHQP